MFCWQCGKELPDEALFCTKCAAKQRRPAAVEQPKAGDGDFDGSVPASASGRLRIAAIVAAVGAIVFMLMPWIGVPVLRSIGQGASAMGIAALSGDYTYTMWGLRDVLDALERVLSKSQYQAVFGAWIIFLIGWAGSLVALVIGLVRAFTGRKSLEFLLGASVALCVVAIVWALVVIALNGALSGELSRATNGYASVKVLEVPMAVYLSAVCGGVAAVFCRTVRAKQVSS